jgi:hypothetical protein
VQHSAEGIGAELAVEGFAELGDHTMRVMRGRCGEQLMVTETSK